MAMRWYVVHAYSNFEHRVAESLKERIARAGLEPRFGEILVPTEEVVEMRDGQKRKSERKFYPGYVLVQMEMDEETWHLVRDVPKVLGFIGGTPEKPAAITDKEANQILRRVEEGVDKPRPKVLFEPGEVVRVVDGPVQRLQRRRGERELREESPAGGSADPGALDARWSWISRRSRRPEMTVGAATALRVLSLIFLAREPHRRLDLRRGMHG